MTKTRLAVIWDDSERGWYFRADHHEGLPPYYPVGSFSDPHLDESELRAAARAYAVYCGVESSGDVDVVR